MLKFSVPFATDKLNLLVKNSLPEEHWNQVKKTVSKIVEESKFLYRDTNSILVRIEDSDVGNLVDIPSPLLYYFLQVGAHYAKLVDLEFTPISGHMEVGNVNLVFEPGEMSVYRSGPVQFHPHRFLTPIVMDKLQQELFDLKISDFCINYRNYYICRGHETWALEFPHPMTKDVINIAVQSGAVFFQDAEDIEERLKQTELNPFSDYRISNGPLSVIVEADTLVHAKLAANLALQTNNISSLRNVSSKWDVGITAFLRDGSVEQFTP